MEGRTKVIYSRVETLYMTTLYYKPSIPHMVIDPTYGIASLSTACHYMRGLAETPV